MKIGSPIDKDSLSINSRLRVLEVGPGSNPTKKANVLVEKFVNDNTHRRGDFKIYPHQKLTQADGENLPFNNKEFDYVICSHVLEHTEDPAKFVGEQVRVSKMGYLEVPSLIGEFLAPKSSHKWVTLDIDNKLVLYEKSKMKIDFLPDFGNLFLNYLPYKSLLYKLLCMSKQNFIAVKYEWKDSVDIIVNPEDNYYKSFFTEKWTPEMVQKIFPQRSVWMELSEIFKSFSYYTMSKLKRTVFPSKEPVSYEEYSRTNQK
ncbi:MAG: methyltransferase domain-containing protein [Bacteroidales bacterium]|nr:methyltransferase domain-containing protein [Bacteroidales bacterium]